jgi:hypothetical protein
MAHKIEWIEEPWVMRVTYIDRITIEDVDVVMKTCVEAVDKHPANFLVEMVNVRFHESNIFRSKDLMKLVIHHNTQWFALVGVNGMLQMAARALLARTRFKSFNTPDEAIAFLCEKAQIQKAEEAALPVKAAAKTI